MVIITQRGPEIPIFKVIYGMKFELQSVNVHKCMTYKTNKGKEGKVPVLN
jgi:hypothetical protein